MNHGVPRPNVADGAGTPTAHQENPSKKHQKALYFTGIVEARVGFEPTNDGFADHSLGPLGYRASVMPKIYAQRTLFSLIYAS
jgi:hypothetical protein